MTSSSGESRKSLRSLKFSDEDQEGDAPVSLLKADPAKEPIFSAHYKNSWDSLEHQRAPVEFVSSVASGRGIAKTRQRLPRCENVA